MKKPEISIFESKLKKLLRFMFFIIAFFLAFVLTRNMWSVYKSSERIDKARLNLERVKKENSELKSALGLIKSDLYIEKQARDKLGLAKENEVVLVLPSEEIVKSFSTKREVEEGFELPDPNWEQWLKLFL
jgi:cell division protein FtsB